MTFEQSICNKIDCLTFHNQLYLTFKVGHFRFRVLYDYLYIFQIAKIKLLIYKNGP